MPSLIVEDGETVDFLRAAQAALVEVRAADRVHPVLFDAGVTPHDVIDDLDRAARCVAALYETASVVTAVDRAARWLSRTSARTHPS